MKESTEKGGLIAIGLALITAGYGIFQTGDPWLGLAAVVVGIALCSASQLLHIEREELSDVKRKMYELEGKVK